MNLELTVEQLALRDTLRQFLAQKAPIAEHVRPMLADETGTTEAVWRGLAQLGTTSLVVPAESGGAGMTMVDAGIVLEELGAALYPGPWMSSAVLSARALTWVEGPANEVLSVISNGSTIATIGPVDPAGRLPTVHGDVLAGDLDLVFDAAAADTLLVIAREAEGYATLYAVPMPAARAHVEPHVGIDQTRKHFRVALDNVSAQRIGAVPEEALSALRDDALIAGAADAVGAARAVAELAIGYAKVRTQFGHAIGSFQAVQHLCVDMFETVELARSGVLYALWAADNADPDERHRAAIAANSVASRLATVADTAIQIFGGIGFTWEHDAHLYLRRLLGWSAFLGTPPRYLEEIGAQLVQSVVQRERHCYD